MHENPTTLGVGVRTLLRSPLFYAGLAVRLLLLVFAAPWLWSNWFLPFVQFFLESPSIDPWTAFMQGPVDPLSYPYGIVMLAINSIAVAIGNLVALITGWGAAPVFGFGLSILAADFVVLVVLCRICGDWSWRLIALYWASPLAIYICYFHGQVDIIPLALLLVGLLALKQRAPVLAGTVIGLSVAAKLTFLLACPLPIIFLWRSKRHRQFLKPFLVSLVLTLVVLQLPYLFSAGVQQMTLGNPNAGGLYRLAVEMAPQYLIYVTPFVYSLFLYYLWRLERLSFDLLIAGTGIAFMTVVMLTPATLGWYMWIVPFLALHQRLVGATSVVLVATLSTAIILTHMIVSTGAAIPLIGFTGDAPLAGMEAKYKHLLPLLATMITVTGVVTGIQIFRWGILRNDFFRLSRQPLTIGIAGDSGSGKDTLALSLGALFGQHSVVAVSGDDYHLWDREGPMWQKFTHLNPHSNDLTAFARDVSQLRNGREVFCRRYDHSTGRFTSAELRRANDCIIVSGLHALFYDGLNRQFDTSIYLDMDEKLREHLKISRDVGERGHSRELVMSAIDNRREDAEKFIKPQARQADIVFSLRPENDDILAVTDDVLEHEALRFRLGVKLGHGILYQDIVKVLVGLCGLRVESESLDEGGVVEFSVEGDVDAEDLELAAHTLMPAIDELLDMTPKWQAGMTGVMQLIVLLQIAETLRHRGESGRMSWL